MRDDDEASLRAAMTSAAVTGTNGKTTTTSWIAAALAAAFGSALCVTTLGAALVRDGLADEALEVERTFDGFLEALRATHERGGRHVAVECTSESLAGGFARRWPSRVAAFTNLTHDHLDAHGSAEHYLASKAQLFMHLPADGVAVLNGCDPACALLEEVLPRGVRVVRYGASTRGEALAPLDLAAHDVEVGRAGTRFRIEAASAELAGTLAIRAHGAIFVENALAALASAVALGVPGDVARAAIARAPAPPGRFQLVRDEPLVAVDYAHTPDALARTLATARALATARDGRVTVVFGAGGRRDRDKRPSMGRAAAAADRVVLTSDNPRDEDPAEIAAAIARGLADHAAVEVELDRAAAIARAIERAEPGDVVVVAGKGHERTQLHGGVERAFDDVAVVAATRRS